MVIVFNKLKSMSLPLQVVNVLFMSLFSVNAFSNDSFNKEKEVVVSASRIPVEASRVGSSVTVITADEIKKSQATSIGDILRSVPGVAVSRTGARGGKTQIRIRGAEGNHTLVIIDGVEMNDPASGSEFEFAHLLVSNIKRIEVLRAPQSAIYGSDAIGGVIVITTKGGTDKNINSVSIEGGTYNTLSVNASNRGGSKKFKYAIGVGRFKTDGFSTFNERNGFTEKDGYTNEAFNLKLNYSLSDILSFSLVLRNVDASADSDSIVFGTGASDTNDVVLTEQSSGRFAAKLDLLGGRWTHNLAFGESRSNTDFETNGTRTFRLRGKKQKLDYQNSFVFGTESSEHIIVTAFERENEKSLSEGFSTLRRDITNLGYALEYRHSYRKKLFTSLSYRFDDNDIFKNAQTGRVTVAYKPSHLKNYRLHASYGTGVKNPTLFELFGSTSSFTGNPNLTPEKAKGYDAGVEFKFYNKRLKLDVTYFNREITDLITGSGTTAVNLNGESPTEGIELSLNWNFSSKVKFNANYSFTNAKTSSGEQQRRRPRNKLFLGLSYKPARKTSYNVNLVHNAGRVQNLFDASFNTTRVQLKNYTVVGFSLRHQYSKSFSLNARIENIFDEQYEEVVTYGTSGRAFYVGINAIF